MRSVGQTPTEKEVQEIIRTLKEEGKQTMDFQDFLQIMAKNMKDCIPEEKVIEAFKVFDKEGKGLISAQELRHIMTSIGQ
jgi:calmodulin